MVDYPLVQVAVGVLQDTAGRVFVALRQKHQHQGGLWEFPGGKVEAGETVFEALKREFFEELGVRLKSASPLIEIRHDYGDIAVQLNVYRIESYSGIPVSKEGQTLRWVDPEQLSNLEFPVANRPIIKALRLPDYYAILDSATVESLNCSGKQTTQKLQECLEQFLQQGLTLIQARLKNLNKYQIQKFVDIAVPLCADYRASLLFNSLLEGGWQFGQSLHLTASDLMTFSTRPPGIKWLAASCHNLQQLQQAEKIGVDFAVLGAVLPTLTHPEHKGMGWESFANLVEKINMPVYALGGMQKSDLLQAKHFGAQGIAGIRLFLE